MPFQSIEPRRLYRQIADQIRELIRAGEFVAGARLPPERDLAKQLGVSRPSVREALIALEVEGLEAALSFLKALGVPLIDETPRIGARGHKVAFVHPSATGGVLVELVEPGEAPG